MFGAHWDHLGIALPVNGDSIYNGAIDNGTGVRCSARNGTCLGRFTPETDGGRRCSRSGPPKKAGLRGAEYYSRASACSARKDGGQHQLRRDISVCAHTGRRCDGRRANVRLADRAGGGAAISARDYAPDPRPEQGSYYRSDTSCSRELVSRPSA